ncbi:MAG: pilus assembly protein PilM [bacterium]|nr:pilus assembly protein PilM [bacterium]
MQNPFSRIGTAIQSALHSGGESVVGVDVGSAYLKVVQLRKKGGKAVLETYGELALGPYGGVEIGRATKLSPEKLSEALRDVMREAHVTTHNAGVAIPFTSSLVTTIEMPELTEKELAVAVPIEARKYVPVPISEVNLDWWIIPDAPADTLPAMQTNVLESAPGAPAPMSAVPKKFKVLIAAIHNEATSRFQTIAKGAYLEPSFYEIEIFATIRALFPQDLLPHAVLDMGAGETKLYIIDQGLLRFSHIINHGSQDLTLALSHALNIPVEEAEKKKRREGIGVGEVSGALQGLLDYIFSEATITLRSFKDRFGREVTDLILSGGGANLAGIEEYGARSCDVKVLRADPFAHVEAPAFLDAVLKQVGPEFSVALGIAFRKLQELS